jgi:hypothetical protein
LGFFSVRDSLRLSIFEELRQTGAGLHEVAASIDAAVLSGADAVQVLEVVTQAERVCAAVRTSMSRRVEQTGVWAREGHKSPEHFLAVKTGTTPSDVEATLATAARLEQAHETSVAFRSGTISPRQAAEVAAAAMADPGQERRLLALAEHATVKHLRDECRRVRHAATDERARYERIRQNRFLHTWTDGEGAFCGRFRTTPDAGARIAAVLEAETDARFKEARAAGEREALAAYAVDALERRLTGDGKVNARTKLVINALVDLPALRRGLDRERGDLRDRRDRTGPRRGGRAVERRALPATAGHRRHRHQGGHAEDPLRR